MPSQEDIYAYFTRLNAHRQTLSLYLQQRALIGVAYIPPSVAHGISESRSQIKIIKQILREGGVAVEDHPDDEEIIYSFQQEGLIDHLHPSLSIYYDDEEEPFTGYAVDADGRLTIFYRLNVKNTGSVAAEDAEGFLVSARQHHNRYNLIGKPMRLKWAHEITIFPIVIEPNESRKLDLLFFFTDVPQMFQFYVEPTLAQGIPKAFQRGTYSVTVRIKCTNARTVESTFRIQTDIASNVAKITQVDG